MADNIVESELKQRGGKETRSEEHETKEIIKKVEEVESTWRTVKYYFNRFRYYHFVVADTIDKYLSAACLLIIKWYFKLFMGVNEPSSALNEEE